MMFKDVCEIKGRNLKTILATATIFLTYQLTWLTNLYATQGQTVIAGAIYNADNDTTADADANIDANYLTNGTKIYREAALSLKPVTDKVTSHTYEIMYGKILLPYYFLNPRMKMLEIGLGCDMGYGPGASVALFQKLFRDAELWEAEYDAACVEKHKGSGKLDGIKTLVGDQGNDIILDGWIEKSGGNFDVVIDDGGHQNCQIWHSFQKLWPTIKPGGLYFIEDMQVAKKKGYRLANTATCDENLIFPEKLKEHFDNLMYDTSRKSDIEFMFCQSEACVLGKKRTYPELHIKSHNEVNV